MMLKDFKQGNFMSNFHFSKIDLACSRKRIGEELLV